jgi:tetratricopeptide (TPR) repeat protein
MPIKAIDTLEKYLLIAAVLLVPLSVSPLFPNYFTTTKIVLLVGIICLSLLAKFAKTIIKGTFTWASTIFDFPLLLLAGAYLASALIRTPNKMEAFFVPGNTTIILAAVLFYFLLNQLTNSKKLVKLALTVSAAIFSVVTIFTTFKLYTFLPFLPTVIKNSNFNLEGSAIAGAIFLASVLPLVLNFALNQKKISIKIVSIAALALVVAGTAASIVQSLPPNLPSMQTSWSIAIDTLKESPLLGVGPGNYLTAYNLYRPISANSSANWNLRFTSAKSAYLTMITETGLVGLAALIILFTTLYKEMKMHLAKLAPKSSLETVVAHTDIYISLTILIVLLVFLPATLTLYLLLAVYLSLNSNPQISTLDMTAKADTHTSHFPAVLLSIPFIGAVIALMFYSYTAVNAEVYYAQALRAISKNDGKTAYDTLIKSINTDSYVDRYHLSYAQVNLALAGTIAQGQNLTDTDKSTISQLVQQSIREGKAAVTLNPQRSGNWATLAGIYQTIIPLAQGSDQYAIDTYTQAITLDPLNPDLRISLGGLYLSLNKTDQAIQVLTLAVAVKPDYANAHYNLASAYKAKGDTANAKAELTTVLSLIDKNSPDYDKAKTDLDNIGSTTAEVTPPVTSPTPSPLPVVKPAITLPQEATPPAASPTP